MSGKIFFKGDTHGSNDIGSISSKYWPEQKKLDKDDYLVVLGDWGILWNNEPDKTEKYYIKWYNDKKCTTLIVDGNHDNHWRLSQLPLIDMFGAKVGKISDSIFHLRRGEVYTIHGKKFFVMGGAMSVDKDPFMYTNHMGRLVRHPGRIEGVSWWREEVPNSIEHRYGMENLDKHNWKVDHILAHTCPTDIIPMVGLKGFEPKEKDPTAAYLQQIVQTTEYESFHFGHFHRDAILGKFHAHYNKVFQLI